MSLIAKLIGSQSLGQSLEIVSLDTESSTLSESDSKFWAVPAKKHTATHGENIAGQEGLAEFPLLDSLLNIIGLLNNYLLTRHY